MHITTIIFAVILWPTLVMAQPTISTDSVAQRIAIDGAKKTVDAMYQNGMEWRQLLTAVATGDEQWLRVAVQLYSGTDAGTTSQLRNSIGEALEHQPQTVLKIVNPALGISGICEAPDVDDKRYDSYSLSTKAIEKRKKMLGAITDPLLAGVRDQCIKELNDSKRGIARFYGVAR
jgi:hypothetical protein